MAGPPKLRFSNNEPLQHYYRDGAGNLYSVARLIDDTKDLKVFNLPLAALDVGDEIWRGCNMFELAAHCKQVFDADLSKPIILDWNGGVADGRHRIIKALMKGNRYVKAVRMQWRPEPCRRAE